MAFELAKAFVTIGTDDTKLRQGLSQVKTRFTSAMSDLTKVAAGFGIGIGLQQAVGFMRQLSAAAEASADAEMRLNAVLKATGEAAGFSAKEIGSFIQELSKATATDDEMISDAISKLLTFKGVTGDVFKKATELAIDLAATGFGSVESAATMLGKALENPLTGMMALTRVGVTLTDTQKQQIKNYTETNQLLKAQQIILDAIMGQVGGVGRETATALKRSRVELDNIKETLGVKVIPLSTKWNEFLVSVLTNVEKVVNAYDRIVQNTDKWIEHNIRQNELMRDTVHMAERIAPSGAGNLLALTQEGIILQGIRATERADMDETVRKHQLAILRRQLEELKFPEKLGGAPKEVPFPARGFSTLAESRAIWEWERRIREDEQRKAEKDAHDARQRLLQLTNARFNLLELRGIGSLFGAISGFLGGALTPNVRERETMPNIGTTSFQGINDAFQQAMNDRQNPVHKTNEILNTGIKRPLEEMAKAAKTSARDFGAAAAGAIKQGLTGLFGVANE